MAEDRTDNGQSNKRPRLAAEEETAAHVPVDPRQAPVDPRQAADFMRLRDDNRRMAILQGIASGSSDLLAELTTSPLAGIPTSQLLSLFPRQGMPSLSSVLPNGNSAGNNLSNLPLSDRLLAAETALARERARTQDPPGSRLTENRLADGINNASSVDPCLGLGMPPGMAAALLMQQAAATAAAMPPSMRQPASVSRNGPSIIEQLIGLDKFASPRVGTFTAQGWPTFPLGGLAPTLASSDPTDMRILAAYLAGRDHEQQYQRMQRAALATGTPSTQEDVARPPPLSAVATSEAKRTHSQMTSIAPPSSAPVVVVPASMPSIESPPVGPPPKLRKVKPQSLYLPADDEDLSEYQCLVRKQIEAFQAEKEDTATSTRGRNRPIVQGQVGIRCRHCKDVPPKDRQRAAIYYPSKLDRLYQMSQTIASIHLAEHCHHIPSDVRSELLRLREAKSAALGGKKYWADAGAAMGLVEHDKRIFYGDKTPVDDSDE